MPDDPTPTYREGYEAGSAVGHAHGFEEALTTYFTEGELRTTRSALAVDIIEQELITHDDRLTHLERELNENVLRVQQSAAQKLRVLTNLVVEHNEHGGV